MRNLYDIRLDKSFRTAPVLALTPHSRIVLISDSVSYTHLTLPTICSV